MSKVPQELWSGWSDEEYRRWQQQRQRGLLFHVLVRWVLCWGVPLLAFNYANRRWGGHMVMDAPWWNWTVGTFLVCYSVVGVANWHWNERQFRIVSALRQRVLDQATQRAKAAEQQP